MGKYIQIDSIYIDLTNYMDNTDPGKCEHFSLRGYVSEIRKKDWKKCWPFPVNESDQDQKPSLPPLDVPKFRWWACESCRQVIIAEGIGKDDRTDLNCSNNGCGSDNIYANVVINSGIHQAPMPDSTHVRREIDLNIPIDFSGDKDHEIENNAEVLPSRITDTATDLENKINHQVISVGSPEVCPGLVQEVKRDKECHEQLRESCSMLREGTTITQHDNVTENPAGHIPPESVVGSDVVPTGNTDKIVNNDCQDHHPKRSIGLYRKRPRKMRLMADILSENGGPKTEKIARDGSASHLPSNASASLQTLSILPDNLDVQGHVTFTKKSRGIKRKLLLDEESERPADMCCQRIENEVQKVEGDAKTIDTITDNRFNDVHVDKKSSKIQHVNHLISEPHQGRNRENRDTLDIANKECASKTISSRFFLHASTEKGIDDFPSLHDLRKEHVRNSSKGKEKMVQADEELDSLSCWKNKDRLVGDSFAHIGAKDISNMPVSIPFLSAQGAPNGEGLEEGLNLSLRWYSSADDCNEKGIRQTENRLPSSSPLLEVTSTPQLIRSDSQTNIFRASRNIKNALSGKGKGILLEEINGAKIKEKTAEAMELWGMKRFYDLTVEESDKSTFDDVPMENISNLPEKSTQNGK